MKKTTIDISNASRTMRFEKVFSVLIKYGFEDILAHPPLNKLLPQQNLLVPSRGGKKVSQYTRYERIRMVCEELGTTFIKFAQIASNRPDLLPDELIQEFEKLQDHAPEVPIQEIRKVIDEETSRPLNEILEYFNPIPLASASMSQVHRARLRGGKEVVLKVQRPNIDKVISSDISLLYSIVNIIEKYLPQYTAYQPRELVIMFEKSISEELNFRLEVNNMIYFQTMFKHNNDVYIPSVYPELSTDRIITMEYIDGYKITDLETLSKYNITGESLAKKGIGLYFEQVFEYGFFHADPHPGNIFVLADGKIVFIDYGMVGTLIEHDKIVFGKILLAMYDNDVQGLKNSILTFSKGITKEKEREFEYDVVYFLREYSKKAIGAIDGNEVMRGLNSLFYDYKIQIPTNLLLLIKALIIIEGVGLQLDPKYDIIQNIGPYVKRLILKKYNPVKLRHELVDSIEDTTNLLKDLPQDIREILYKLKEGKLHIEIDHNGLGPFANSMGNSINRLSYTLVVMSLILASSIITLAKTPPLYHDISLIGIIGFGISILMALILIRYLRKTTKSSDL